MDPAAVIARALKAKFASARYELDRRESGGGSPKRAPVDRRRTLDSSGAADETLDDSFEVPEHSFTRLRHTAAASPLGAMQLDGGGGTSSLNTSGISPAAILKPRRYTQIQKPEPPKLVS